MDQPTISAYDHASGEYAREWREQPAPDDMYALLRQFFSPGPTLDIGCGSGRDVAWLRANGFDASGYDASEGLLLEAKRSYPDAHFGFGSLPALDGLTHGVYQNVLCETVLMHLHPVDIPESTRSLVRLLKPGGALYLSWRVTRCESLRDDGGRLYAAFPRGTVMDALGEMSDVLFDREDISTSSGKVVHRVVARRRLDR